MDDLYRILGVNRSATLDEIKTAYHNLALKYHPDFNQGDTHAEYLFKKVSSAYAVLSDSSLKARYDSELFRMKFMGLNDTDWKNPYDDYSAADFVGAFNYFFNAHQKNTSPVVLGSVPKKPYGYETIVWGVVIFIAAFIVARFTGRLGFLGMLIGFAILFFGIRFIIKGFLEVLNNYRMKK